MKKRRYNQQPQEPVPGMNVKSTKGDIGEQDVSNAKVAETEKDEQGNVEAIKVRKGLIFRKTIDVPAQRIEDVQPAPPDDEEAGTVEINVNEDELESLNKRGEQEVAAEEPMNADLLDQIEQQAPTEQGLREKEAGIHVPRPKSTFWRIIGPGLLSGTAGNDSSAVTTYAVNGATVGYGHLWLVLLSTPLYLAVQFTCAKIGRVSKKGISQLLREHYGMPIAALLSGLLVISNIALIASDLAAIGSGLELITKLAWWWFVVPVAALLWYIVVFGSFESFKKIFLVMSLILITYILAAFFTHADWGSILFHTVVPQIDFKFAAISSAVALLGATISPFSMFWQAQGEIEEKRAGNLTQQIGAMKLDVASGAMSGQIVAYFIIVTTASTLFIHHQNINSAADAARALEPLVGPLADYLFAIGLIGSGLVAIPVLLASTSYAVAGTIGWPAGLSKRPWQDEGFYLIMTASLLVSILIALFRVNPISLIFWSNVMAGVLAPLLVLAIFLLGNHRSIMGHERLSWLNNTGLVLIILILLTASVLLFQGLATGQAGS